MGTNVKGSEDISRRCFLCDMGAVVAGVPLFAAGTQQQKAEEPKALDDPKVAHGMVSFKSGADTIEAYLARPQAAGRYRGVVILHGNIGVPDDHRNTAAQLAQGGYVGLAVKRFSRTPGITFRDLERERDYYLGNTFDEQELSDAVAAVEYLWTRPFIKKGGIGMVGFCGGGRQALVLSTKSKKIRAVVSFYGPPLLTPQFQPSKPPFKTNVMEVVKQIRVPVQGHYGANDPFIPLADVRRFEQALREQHTPAEIFIYENATHAFYDYTRPYFNPGAAKLARTRMLGFFKRYLR